jgi:PKD repeat protein
MAGESVFFQDESLNLPTNWVWQFEGGTPTTSYTSNSLVYYDTPGVYDVTLVASNSNGSDVLTMTNYIEVLENSNPPVADFSSNINIVLAGESVFFQDESTNLPTNWVWHFEGGSPATSYTANSLVTYNTPGKYDVQLIAANPNGFDIITKTNYIEVVKEKKGEILDDGTDSFDEISNLMTLYPNPAIDYINVNVSAVENNKYTIMIYSLYGELVKEMEFNTVPGVLNKKIDVSQLRIGTYILHLNDGNTADRRKFFKL